MMSGIVYYFRFVHRYNNYMNLVRHLNISRTRTLIKTYLRFDIFLCFMNMCVYITMFNLRYQRHALDLYSNICHEMTTYHAHMSWKNLALNLFVSSMPNWVYYACPNLRPTIRYRCPFMMIMNGILVICEIFYLWFVEIVCIV